MQDFIPQRGRSLTHLGLSVFYVCGGSGSIGRDGAHKHRSCRRCCPAAAPRCHAWQQAGKASQFCLLQPSVRGVSSAMEISVVFVKFTALKFIEKVNTWRMQSMNAARTGPKGPISRAIVEPCGGIVAPTISGSKIVHKLQQDEMRARYSAPLKDVSVSKLLPSAEPEHGLRGNKSCTYLSTLHNINIRCKIARNARAILQRSGEASPVHHGPPAILAQSSFRREDRALLDSYLSCLRNAPPAPLHNVHPPQSLQCNASWQLGGKSLIYPENTRMGHITSLSPKSSHYTYGC